MDTNKRKTEVLGEPFGTASAKLRKLLLFDAIGRLGERDCYRCGLAIDRIGDFSIEHKQSWMYADNAVEAFYSLDNISYSHIKCNVAAAHRPNKIYVDKKQQSREAFKRYYAKNSAEWNARRNERRRNS